MLENRVGMNTTFEKPLQKIKLKINPQSVLLAWKKKWGDIPSLTITNTDSSWAILIVSRKNRVRLSFIADNYRDLIKHVFDLGNDPTYYPSKAISENEISEKIKKLRKESKITQKTLANAMGVSQSTIAEWEGGLGVSDEIYEKIRDILQGIMSNV